MRPLLQAGIRNFIICICISNSLHRENRGQRRRASMKANSRQTIVYMQMLANFCQHLPIYNQAYSFLSLFTAKHGCGFEGNIQETLNFQPLRLNLTQKLLHKRLMHKYNQWFSRKTWDMQPPGHREQKNKDALGGGGRRDLLQVTVQPNCQKTEGLPPGLMLCVCISFLGKKGYGKPKRDTMKKMPPNS